MTTLEGTKDSLHPGQIFIPIMNRFCCRYLWEDQRLLPNEGIGGGGNSSKLPFEGHASIPTHT